jgi:hypothetical protein
MTPLAAAAIAALSFIPSAPHHAPPNHRGCHRWIVVSEQYVDSGGRTNVCPRGRMDIVMADRDNDETPWYVDCNDWGGEPIEYPRTGVKVCEGVDH